MLLKLKRTPGIYLVGFMGSGKTTIGRLLAEEIGWNFTDVDALIEGQQKETIARIFEMSGEPEFRRLEHDAIRSCVRKVERGQPAVLALGGGAFLQQNNFELLGNNGVSVWLDCPFDLIAARVRLNGNRPLARDIESLRTLYDERRPGYERADFRIAVGHCPPRQNVAAVMDLPLFK
jgi:shikimate kinase